MSGKQKTTKSGEEKPSTPSGADENPSSPERPGLGPAVQKDPTVTSTKKKPWWRIHLLQPKSNKPKDPFKKNKD